ncbi:MAG: ATP-binding protein [Candidatus Uhrbacteria bacterium]
MKLIVVGGSLATGKSTISTLIAEKTGFARVSLDEIKEALFDLVGYRDRAWSKEIGRVAFPAFRDCIELHLQRGDSVIADATFLWVSDADWLHEFSEKYGAEIVQVWLTADPQIARQRMIVRSQTTRHPGHNDALESVMDEFDERFFNKTFIPLPLRARTIVVDTTDIGAVDHNGIVAFVRDP